MAPRDLEPAPPQSGDQEKPQQQQQESQQQQQEWSQQQSGEPMQASTTSTADSKKIKLIQQHLIILVHAHKCQQQENQLGANGQLQCALPYCAAMKNVLSHITTCQAGTYCTFRYCLSSRQIISHWKYCTNSNCRLMCGRFKQAGQNGNNPNVDAGAEVSQEMVLNLSLPLEGEQGAEAPPAQQGSSAAQQMAASNQQLAADIQAINLSLPLTETFGSADNNSATFYLLPRIVQPVLRGSIPVQANKEWQNSVTPDLRSYLIQKLVQAFSPKPSPEVMLDEQMDNLFDVARKVESDIYNTASSRMEYYHFLAETVYSIQEEEKLQNEIKEQQN